jgi:Flp pilus assembly protein TadG
MKVRDRRESCSGPQGGQSLVEATLVLLVFFAMLLGVVDCGQVLFAHQALVERVREAVRWGSVRQFDGTGEQIANMVLYDRPDPAASSGTGYLGLTRANVQVRYRPSTAERPDDETLSVAIVNYESHFFSPWIAKTVINPRPVLVSAPMAYRVAQQQ